EDLPPAVVDKAKAVVNHAVTVGMAGFGAARTAAARRAVLAHERLGERHVGAGQGATLWVDGTRVTRAGAAFANGVAVAVNNQCDSYHMLTHPGVLLVPAGLATAEGEGRSARGADCAVAQAARGGMWAAALAAEGFEGAATALEGEGGFYNAFTGSHRGDLTYSFTGPLKADLHEIVADLGRRWEFLDVKFK